MFPRSYLWLLLIFGALVSPKSAASVSATSQEDGCLCEERINNILSLVESLTTNLEIEKKARLDAEINFYERIQGLQLQSNIIEQALEKEKKTIRTIQEGIIRWRIGVAQNLIHLEKSNASIYEMVQKLENKTEDLEKTVEDEGNKRMELELKFDEKLHIVGNRTGRCEKAIEQGEDSRGEEEGELLSMQQIVGNQTENCQRYIQEEREARKDIVSKLERKMQSVGIQIENCERGIQLENEEGIKIVQEVIAAWRISVTEKLILIGMTNTSIHERLQRVENRTEELKKAVEEEGRMRMELEGRILTNISSENSKTQMQYLSVMDNIVRVEERVREAEEGVNLLQDVRNSVYKEHKEEEESVFRL